MSTDLVIILSTDWVSSTSTRAQLGEDRADALQELHDTLLQRAVEGNAGKVVKHSGDGVLAIFHSATAALGATLKIQHDFAAYRASQDALAPIEVRTGLAAGDVKHQRDDIFGLPVVEAVRLQSAAAPNEILCSDLVRALSQGRGGFVFEDVGTKELKGLPAPVHVLRVRQDTLASPPGFAVRTGSVPMLPVARPRSGSTLWYAVAAVLVLAGGLLAYRFFEADVPVGAPPTPPSTSTDAAASPPLGGKHSIAVLPFANLSPNENDAYFAIGIHEEILNQLTKLGSLDVVSRTTVQRYAGGDKPIAEIARELDVGTVLEGSVRYAEGSVVITTQLIDGASDRHIWSESYTREFSNIFAIQTDVALKVAEALQATLLPAEQAQLERAPTTSLAAYDLYLSATARDIRQTPAEILKGLEEIEQALMLDPSFALGWTRKANLAAVAQFFDPGRSAEHQATGVQAARRALELDPQLAGAHAALGFALSTTNDWIGGEAAFREARNLNMPLGDMPAYSPLLLSVGNFEYAREVLQETRAVVPQNPTALGFLITANALLGDEAAARSQYEQGKSLFSPWNGDLSQMYWYLGRGEIAAARALDPPGVSAVMRPLFDTPEAALRELRRLRTDPAFANPVSQKDIALWAAYLGDTSLALEAMRSTVERQGTQLLYAWYPVFAEARKLPEFKILLRDLGVVAYWNEYGWQAVCRPLGADDFECQ